MRDEKIIERLLEDKGIKGSSIKKEVVRYIIDKYNEATINELLSKGHIELSNGMNIEIVRLIDRVHVLRGVSYKSNRKYKLKLTMEDNLYNAIESYYDKLQEEIG